MGWSLSCAPRMRKRACCSKLFFRPRGSMKRNMFSLYIFVQFSTFSLFWFDQENIGGKHTPFGDAACMLDSGVISTKESRAFSLFVSHQVPTKCFFVREYWIHFILQTGPPHPCLPTLSFSQFGLLGFQLGSGIGTHAHNNPSKRNETKRTRTRIAWQFNGSCPGP